MHLFQKEKTYGDRLLAEDDCGNKVSYEDLHSFAEELYGHTRGKP